MAKNCIPLTTVVALLMLCPAQGSSPQDTVNTRTAPIMPLSEIKPGQIGKVRTVFQGTRIEEFECEVIGVLKNSIGPKKHMIMVKLRGEKPEFTGVVAGMSGSPVYIDGKLVGALAYRWGVFSKEPIAGITPIEDMFEVASYNEPHQRRRGAGGASRVPPGNWGEIAGLVDLPPGGGFHSRGPIAKDEGSSGATPIMVPIATPLIISGFNRRLVDHFSPLFEQNNFITMIGGGPTSETSPGTELEPGSALATLLMSGDMSIAATGTVTYRDGNKLFAFGHPLFQVGATDVPMAKAEVVMTLSSALASFKVAQPTGVVGAVRQDRLTAIMGEIGARARMIPISVEVHTARDETRSYAFEVFEEPLFTPLLLNFAVANTVLGATENESAQTIAIKGKIEIDGHAPLELEEVMASDDIDLAFPLALRASGYVTRLFGSLYNNPIQRPLVNKVSIRIDQSAERKAAVIEEVRADREEIKPGEEMTLAVIIRPYRQDRITRTVKIKLPETAERGREMRVMVSDAMTFEAAEGRFGRAPAQARSLDDLISQLNQVHPSSAFYIRVSQSTPGAFVNQQALPSLPLSVLSVIGSTQTAANTVAATDSALLVRIEPVDYPVSGRRSILLMVR